MIKQECIGIPDMILLLMIFCFKKIKIKAEIVLSPGGAYFKTKLFSWEFYLEVKIVFFYIWLIFLRVEKILVRTRGLDDICTKLQLISLNDFDQSNREDCFNLYRLSQYDLSW